MSYQKQRLADISTMKTGKLNSNAAVVGGMYPFFTCAQETYWIDKPAFNTEAVILGGNNANGIFPLKYYNGEFNAYQRTYIFETKDANTLNIRYLYYALRPALSQFQAASIGAATQYLTKPILDNFKVSLPEIDQQDKIVSILSSYDDLIENNKRRIELLEESARQLYKEWFMRFRFPGHEHVKIIDGVPVGWTPCYVGDLFTLQRGFDLPVSDRIDGNIPVYASTGINGYHNEHKVKGPGLVTGRSGSLGKVIYISKDFWPLNTALWIKEFKQVDVCFALYLLRNLKLENYNGGAAVPTLNRNDVHSIETFLPPQNMLESFSENIKPVFAQIDLLDEQNIKLTKARDLLLPKLMSGAINV
jgi:type I restriction enzyme, S subunit